MKKYYKAGVVVCFSAFFIFLGWFLKGFVDQKAAMETIERHQAEQEAVYDGKKDEGAMFETEPEKVLSREEKRASEIIEKEIKKSDGRDRELALVPTYREEDVEALSPALVEKEKENMGFAVVKGHVQIPSVGINLGIYEGINNANLLLGAAEQCPRDEIVMGGVGNYILCGHYCYWNSSYYFTELKSVKSGDKVYVSNDDSTYVYEVVWSKKVGKDDTGPINEETNEKLITLYTCGNFSNNSKDRWVVRGKLIEDVDENVLM